MNTCKNCSNEFDGKYCNACGQVYIEKQTFKTFFKGFIDAIDINNKFLSSLIGIFITPGRLVRDYSEGRTNRYIGPITMMLIVVSLGYLLSESNILGFSLVTSENEFYVFYNNTKGALLAAIIASFLPFTAYKWVKFMTLSLYFISGFYLLITLVDIVSGFEWIYQSSNLFSETLSYGIFVYVIYYLFAVFKGHYRTMIIFVVLFIAIDEIYDQAANFVVNEPERETIENFYYQIENPIPTWSYHKLYSENFFNKNIISDSSYFANDVNNDGIRDITTFVGDSVGNNYMITVSIKEDKAQTICLNDLFAVRNSTNIISVSSSNESNEAFRLLYSDSSKYVIYWKENNFYGSKIY